jgi:hypothetical protein
MRARTLRDHGEVIEFKPTPAERFEGLLPEARKEAEKEDESVQGGVSIALVRGQDESIAFSMHAREWLHNRWGDKRFVKIEMHCGHHSVEDLAVFFERCAARLRNMP